jgi:hypothetical protein
MHRRLHFIDTRNSYKSREEKLIFMDFTGFYEIYEKLLTAIYIYFKTKFILHNYGFLYFLTLIYVKDRTCILLVEKNGYLFFMIMQKLRRVFIDGPSRSKSKLFEIISLVRI